MLDTDDLLALAGMAGRLKRVDRAGWVAAGVARPESVADHSYRVALLALALAEPLGLDVGRVAALALVHDLAEAEVGDVRIDPGLPDADARRAAKGAAEVRALAGVVRDPVWRSWLEEYQAAATPEARLVKSIDRLEMALTALDYELAGEGSGLGQFWASAAAGIEGGPVAAVFHAARRRRPTMLQDAAPGIRYWQRFSEEKGLHFNGWRIETAGGVFLVDPPDAPDEVLDALGSPAAVLLTNRTHARATARMVERFGCPVLCHEAETVTTVAIDETFAAGDRLGGELFVHAVPGKTIGEVCFELARDGGSLVVGDTLIGDPPGEVRLLPPDKIDDPDALERSLALFGEATYERLLLGDGEPILAGARAAFDRFRERRG